MELPVLPPVSPMLAKATGELPEGEGWWFEPKWDGFRCIVFRDGDEVGLGSRNERPLTRYFPELVDPIRRSLPGRCVVDGELVVVGAHGLDFDALLQRIHPAESRVRTLAAATPASFVAFDLLALDDDDLRPSPYASRRAALEAALDRARPPIHLTPATTDRTLAADWFERFEGAGLDGVVAKPGDDPYVEGKRTQLKVKHQRTADVVVAGYRTHKQGGVGSLLLGLHDDRGTLQHVGVASGFRAADRPRLAEQLAPLRADDDPDHPWATWAGADGADGDRRPGAPSRWNAAKDLSWTPLRPELVAEVAYDHLQGDRFRHATRLVRWRPDRRPESCRYDQLEAPVPIELRRVFGG
jgi:ATP-dependent DNA ligase